MQTKKLTLSQFTAQLGHELGLDNFDEQSVLKAVKELIAERDEPASDDTEEEDEDEKMLDEAGTLRALQALAEELHLSTQQVDLIAMAADPVGAARRELSLSKVQIVQLRKELA